MSLGLAPIALADTPDTPTASIQNVSPLGGIAPGSSVSFAVSSSGFFNPVYVVSDSFSGTGATTGYIDQVGFFTWTPTVYDSGRHTFTVTVTDASSNTASASVTILVTGSAAFISGIYPGPIISAGKPVTFTVTTVGMTSPQIAIYDSVYGGTANQSSISSSGTVSWTPSPYYDIGSHTLRVVASDLYGHSAEATTSITVLNPSVTVDSIQPGSTVRAGTTISAHVRTPFTTPTTFSLSDAFTGTSTLSTTPISSTGNLNWKTTDDDLGLHPVTFTATDAYQNSASTTISFMVVPVSADLAYTYAPPSTSSTPSSSSPSSSSGTPSHPVFMFTTALAVGSRGSAVTELQKRLTALGVYSGPVTGYYGSLTAAAVKKFQKAHGIAPVGFVGPATRSALNQVSN